jgi:hypothetical protein
MDCLVRARPGVYDFRWAAQIKTSVQVVEQASEALGIVHMIFQEGKVFLQRENSSLATCRFSTCRSAICNELHTPPSRLTA